MAANDSLVIGAGAAGLAAAVCLAAEGRSVQVLEARDRVGGRCLSAPDAGARSLAPGFPAELGAEFVHGEARATVQVMRRQGLVAIDAAEDRWLLRRGRLRPANDAFEDMMRAFKRKGPGRRDECFADFLARFDRRSLPREERQLALSLVEGFDAADPRRVSAREIVEEWTNAGVLGQQQSRLLGGYAAMCNALASEAVAKGAGIRLRTVVRRIRWRRGEVLVDASSGSGNAATDTYRARSAIVTVPLGVLQGRAGEEGAIEFDPPLRTKRWPLAHLAPGPVVKLVLDFAEPFWEHLADGRYRNAAFFLAPSRRFPTFWTAVPLRVPRLVAWAGGPRAVALAGLQQDELTQIALEDLSAILGCPRIHARELRAVHFHDWQADPYARGAYSFVTVGGASARQRLAAPLARTLFFAGEAANWQGEAATVSGAIASGERAARGVLRAAPRRRSPAVRSGSRRGS